MKQHLFSTVFVLVLIAATALAQRYNIADGDIAFTKNTNTYDLDVTQNGGTVTVVFTNNAFPSIVIYGNGTPSENIITVDTDWQGTEDHAIPIIFSNVLIQSSERTPITLLNQSILKLFLAANTSNELTTTAIGYPGLYVPANSSASLKILGSGTLLVNGGELSAGIGGDYSSDCGAVAIEGSATVIARGGMGGSGIGGGEATHGGTITITSNATVIAIGGNGGTTIFEGGYEVGGAAGIGGGGSTTYGSGSGGGSGGHVTISGNARVTAQAGEFAAGIGGGENGSGGIISIGPSTKVVALSDKTLPAIHDDDGTLAGNGYVMQLDYYNPKTAGTTNTVHLTGSVVANAVAAVDYQSIAFSLAAATTYRVRCNNIPQESQGDTKFPVLETGLKVFTYVADTNSLPFTTTTPVEVPYEWLAEYYPSTPENEYENLANSVGTNRVDVWESYVAGLVPTNATSTFTASIALTNGTPYISWTPVLEERTYTVQGKTNLSDSAWGPTNSASRFFNVTVEMP